MVSRDDRRMGNKSILTVVLALWCVAVSLSPCTARKDRNAGHPHQGSLGRYNPGPFNTLKLGGGDEKHLSNGKSVMKQIPADGPDSSGGKAICVQDVDAPRKAVWNQILDFNNYVGKVSKLKECKNYFRKKNSDGTSTIKTKMVIGVMPGYKYEYYCDHTFHPNKDSLTWTLDYDKYSDFDDSVGHWHLEDHPKKPGCTRVFYACDLKFWGKVPGPVKTILTKQALKTATQWVKKESEKKPEAEPTGEVALAF